MFQKSLVMALIYLEGLTMEDQNKLLELRTGIANKSMLDLKHLCTFSDLRILQCKFQVSVPWS